jgi:hypothetical protein
VVRTGSPGDGSLAAAAAQPIIANVRYDGIAFEDENPLLEVFFVAAGRFFSCSSGVLASKLACAGCR